MGFLKKIRSGSGSGPDFIKKFETRPETRPGYNPVPLKLLKTHLIYIDICLVVNPNPVHHPPLSNPVYHLPLPNPLISLSLTPSRSQSPASVAHALTASISGLSHSRLHPNPQSPCHSCSHALSQAALGLTLSHSHSISQLTQSLTHS